MRERVELKLKIHGRVHGVGFRYFAKLKARDLGLVGYGKNLPDGTVEIVAQGTKENLEKFADWAKAGPRSAGVNRLELQFAPARQKFSTFSIL